MSVFKKTLLLLIGCSLLCCTACAKQEETSQAQAEITPEEYTIFTGAADSEAPATKAPLQTPENETREDGSADIYITIPTVEVSLADLKSSDYTVPVYVALEQNAGLTYAEWGASYDKRCTLEYEKFDSQVTFNNIVCSVNEEQHFFWTAWASSDSDPRTGNLILLNIKLPADAKAGDSYPITYEPVSLANKPHVWNDTKNNWVKDGVVGWTDGGITVTE